MKIFYIISWSILLTGLIFRLLHFTGGGTLVSLSGLFLFIHSIIHLIKFAKSELSLSLLYLSVACITIYLIGRIQFWGFVKPLFVIDFLLTWACLFVHAVKRKRFQYPQLLLILYFVFFYLISYTPSYKIYYVEHLNPVLNKNLRNTDYRSWDSYSWFLYIRDKQGEAIEANYKSRAAAELCIKNSNDDEAIQYLNVIKQHENKSKTKTGLNTGNK